MSEPQMMRLHSGLHVNPLDLKPEEILIEDIAHGLALENRFGNQSKIPISVAQHSWYVSRLCKRHGPNVALAGLLHDASEAYLCDIITWVKNATGMEFYRSVQAELQMKIYDRFGVGQDIDVYRSVGEYDLLMRNVEGLHAFKQWEVTAGFNLDDNESFAIVKDWYPVNWEAAKGEFLKQFDKLNKEIERQRNG